MNGKTLGLNKSEIIKESNSKVSDDVSKRILEQEKFVHKAVFSSESLLSAHNYLNN